MPSADVAVSLTQAELQLADHQLEQALAVVGEGDEAGRVGPLLEGELAQGLRGVGERVGAPAFEEDVDQMEHRALPRFADDGSHVVLARAGSEDPPLSALAGALADHPCQGILLALPPVASGRAALHLRRAGFRGLLAGPGWLVGASFAAAAGAAAEGLVVSVPVSPSTIATGSRIRTERN